MVKQLRRLFRTLALLGMLVAANFALGQPVAQACLGMTGNGGTDSLEWWVEDCQAGEMCRWAYCMCGEDGWDQACTPLRVCAGQCSESRE